MNTAITDCLTEQDVYSAIEAMIAAGEKPSASKLLKTLGRGSLGVIAKHLANFNAANNSHAKTITPPLPADTPVSPSSSKSPTTLAGHEPEQQPAAVQAEAAVKINQAMELSKMQVKYIEDLENLLDELRLIITQKDESIKELESDVKNLTKQLNAETKNSAVLKTNLNIAEKTVDYLKAELIDRDKKLDEKAREIIGLEKTNKSLVLRMDKNQIALDRQIDALEALMEELTSGKTDCNKEVAASELSLLK